MAKVEAELSSKHNTNTKSDLEIFATQSSAEMLSRHNPDGIYLYASPNAPTLSGYSPGELVGHSFYELLHPSDAEIVREAFQKVLITENSNPGEISYRLLKKDGEYCWFETRYKLINTHEGQEIVAVSRNISDLKQIQDSLTASQQQLKTIVTNATLVIYALNQEGIFTLSDGRGLSSLGLSAGEAVGRSVFEMYKDYPLILEDVRQVLSGNEVKVVRELGSNVFELWMTPVRDNQGLVSGIIGLGSDITARVLAERQLRESEENYRSLAEVIPQLIWRTDPNGYVNYYNQRWYDYTGQTPEEAEGNGWQTIIHPDDQQSTRQHWNEAVEKGELYNIEYRLRGADGTYRWFLARGLPMKDASGQIKVWFGSSTDIDELKKSRERTALLQAVTEALSQSLSRVEVARIILEQGLSAVNASAGSVMQLVGEAGNELSKGEAYLEILTAVGTTEETTTQWGYLRIDQTNIPAFDAVRSGKSIWIEDISNPLWQTRYPSLLNLQYAGDRKAFALVPLKLKEQTLGVLNFSFDSPRYFEEAEKAMLLALAQQCAQSLERARLYEAEQDARAKAEAASQRFAFLARTGDALAASLDYEVTLQTVARLALPDFADYCIIDLIEEENNSLKRLAVAHVDPVKEQLMWEVQRLYPPDMQSKIGIPRALQTGKPEFVAMIEPDMLKPFSQNEEHLKVLLELAPVSGISAPLISGDQNIGVISLAYSDSGRMYHPSDLELVTELARRATLAIENARLYRREQEAITLREEFLSIAAHELKTPITSLKGYAQLANREIAKGSNLELNRIKRALEVIDRQSDKLANLVAQLLDVSRLVLGNLSLDYMWGDLRKIAEEVVADARLTTSAHTLSVDGPEAVPLRIDPVRIEQVLTNLVTNAIKYSPQGGPVEVELKAFPESKTVQLSVTDRGIGINPEHRTRIFERFYRVNTEERTAGFGLGLYISYQIVQLHGGNIMVELPQGGGSRFVVTLPYGVE
ncbi:MAG TPA: PAS domain S-box protein [Chloroflexia bacterium]|nr:PAS domain S-box protein [Chloroflexia bacterium]